MIEDLLQMRAHLDTMIETYKDLHPDDVTYDEYSQTHTAYRDDEVVKQTALKRVREGYYENKFSKSKGKETSGSSKGQSTLCVYGDT